MDEEILTRLERIERRLDALEGRTSRPPVFVPMPTGPPLPEARDIEGLIGTRWLPRAGAVAVVSALAYLVGLGLQRGIVTPTTVAVGIAFACLLTALGGARLKGDRATFGNVLVGLGTGGLYVDAVGAHFYQGLLSGEAMVGTTFLISLAALGFGARRALPSFLGIGLFGGLVAALMPLSKGAVPISTILFLLVAAPAFAVAAWRRWPMAVAGLWLGAFGAALGILCEPGGLFVGHLPLMAALVMAFAAWVYAAEPLPKEDPQGAFPFAAAVATGAASLFAESGWSGVGHVAALGAATMGASWLFRMRPAAKRTRAAGALLSLAIAPLAFTPPVASAVLAGLSIVVAFAAMARTGGGLVERSPKADSPDYRWVRLASATLAAIQAILALGSYAVALLKPVPYETGLILLLAVAAILAATVFDRKEARGAAGVALWALATRLGVVALSLAPNAAVTVAWTVVLAGLLGVGFAFRRPELRQLGLVVAAATAAKVALVDLADLDAALKATVLLGLGLVLLGGGYAYVRARRT